MLASPNALVSHLNGSDSVLQPYKCQSGKRNTSSNLVGSDNLKCSITVTGFQERRKDLRPIMPEKGLCMNGIETKYFKEM